MTCPNCGSQEWKSASLVYKEGAFILASTSVGIGLSSGGTHTELSKLTAPLAASVNTTRCLSSPFSLPASYGPL